MPGTATWAILLLATSTPGHIMSEQSTAQRALADLQPKIGQEIHCSDWLLVSQQRINEFAQATSDHQWIHTDPVRACLLYTSDAADDLLCVDLGGLRNIKKKNTL